MYEFDLMQKNVNSIVEKNLSVTAFILLCACIILNM